VVAEPPPLIWILHSDPVLREAYVAAARQVGLIGIPVESAAQGLDWLNHNHGLIPDLILFDDAVGDMAPAQFATALTEALAEALGELAPPVIYIVSSEESAEALISSSLKPGLDVVLRRPVPARDVARAIFSVLRRAAEEDSVLHAHGLELDVVRRMLGYRDRNIHLTRFECGFMEYLMWRRDRVVTNDELLEHVWGFEPGTGTLEVLRAHVRNLRRKLQLLGAPRDLIWTLPGRGYRLKEPLNGQPPGNLYPPAPAATPDLETHALASRTEST
jgi:two-component system response regulator MprA/two-component system response regulator PrrA